MTRNLRHALIIDDDPTVAPILKKYLDLPDKSCVAIDSIEKLEQRVFEQTIDVIFLDIQLSDTENGLDNISKLQEKFSESAIIVISSTSFDEAIDNALDCGADDFIPKPLRKSEVLARVNSALGRRTLDNPKASIKLSSTNFSRKQNRLSGPTGRVFLQTNDARVFECLSERFETIVSRQNIFRIVWGDIHVSANSLDQSIRRIRCALTEITSTIEIVSVRSKGYIMRYKSRDHSSH